jgi:hypothetical protein
MQDMTRETSRSGQGMQEHNFQRPPELEDARKKPSVAFSNVEVSDSEASKKTLLSPRDESPESPHPREHHNGVYWRSPVSMIALFLLGILMAIGHHLYYASLRSKEVGNDNEQQWALRSLISSFSSHLPAQFPLG